MADLKVSEAEIKNKIPIRNYPGIFNCYFLIYLLLNNQVTGADEMAQKLRVLGSSRGQRLDSQHLQGSLSCRSRSRGTDTLSCTRHMCDSQTYIQTKYPYTLNKQSFI